MTCTSPTTDPGTGATRGRIDRLTRVGFEVRADVATADQVVLATMTRTEATGLAPRGGGDGVALPRSRRPHRAGRHRAAWSRDDDPLLTS